MYNLKATFLNNMSTMHSSQDSQLRGLNRIMSMQIKHLKILCNYNEMFKSKKSMKDWFYCIAIN